MEKGYENACPTVGQELFVIPTHICPTSALYPSVFVVEKGRIVDEWEVTARNRKLMFWFDVRWVDGIFNRKKKVKTKNWDDWYFGGTGELKSTAVYDKWQRDAHPVKSGRTSLCLQKDDTNSGKHAVGKNKGLAERLRYNKFRRSKSK